MKSEKLNHVKTMPYHMHARVIAATLLALSLAAAATASHAVAMYTDKTSFLSATGASSIGALPSTGGSGTTVGSVTFTSGVPAGSVVFGEWSTEISGYDLALSGIENFNLSIAGGAFSFGFDVHEPTTPYPVTFPDGCNTAACVDSIFNIEVWSGASLLDTFTYNAPDDPAITADGDIGFFGVHSAVSFDFIKVTEIVGTNDNEYFGNFLSGSRAASVPEPSVLALIGAGLAGIGFRRGRRK